MTEQKINSEFCFDSSKKLTIEIAHNARKNYDEKLSTALGFQKSIPIIVDTNVLLAYYETSQVEKKILIEFLNENKDRIFLTSQIEKEFLRNRIKVIDKQYSALNSIELEFQATYKSIKNKFTAFLNSKKSILSKDYPAIWNLLSHKQTRLDEILEDEETLSQTIAEAINTTIMDYKEIYVVDKLLEACANLKVTSALSDEEIDFIKEQYNDLRQKYEAVEKVEIKRQIVFPGCADKPDKKEDPYGDFIIFHEILKFMLCGKDGLEKTDVIFLTQEKAKGDWIHRDLSPITHYIEKAFLVTDKTLFIIHADKLLEISFENIYENSQQPLSSEFWLENKLYSIKKNGSSSAAYMGHYRGWTILVSLSSYDKFWNVFAINTLCYNYVDFMQLMNEDNTTLPILANRSSAKEEGYITIKCEIDKTFEFT